MKHDYLHMKQTTCRVVFLQGCHVSKSCKNIWKPAANPQNGNMFKTFPDRIFSNERIFHPRSRSVWMPASGKVRTILKLSIGKQQKLYKRQGMLKIPLPVCDSGQVLHEALVTSRTDWVMGTAFQHLLLPIWLRGFVHLARTSQLWGLLVCGI